MLGTVEGEDEEEAVEGGGASPSLFPRAMTGVPFRELEPEEVELLSSFSFSFSGNKGITERL